MAIEFRGFIDHSLLKKRNTTNSSSLFSFWTQIRLQLYFVGGFKRLANTFGFFCFSQLIMLDKTNRLKNATQTKKNNKAI